MRINFTKTKGIVLLALLGSVVGTSNPALAAPKNLQWRSTRCQIVKDDTVVRWMNCTVAFGPDAKLFSVKFFNPKDGKYKYYNYDQNYTYKTDVNECLTVEYDDKKDLSYCTVKTPWELGIKGAPRKFSEPEPAPSYDTRPAPSYDTRPAGSDPNSFFNIRARCDRAYPGHGYVNHPDKEGWKRCVKMSGQY